MDVSWKIARGSSRTRLRNVVVHAFTKISCLTHVCGSFFAEITRQEINHVFTVAIYLTSDFPIECPTSNQ